MYGFPPYDDDKIGQESLAGSRQWAADFLQDHQEDDWEGDSRTTRRLVQGMVGRFMGSYMINESTKNSRVSALVVKASGAIFVERSGAGC